MRRRTLTIALLGLAGAGALLAPRLGARLRPVPAEIATPVKRPDVEIVAAPVVAPPPVVIAPPSLPELPPIVEAPPAPIPEVHERPAPPIRHAPRVRPRIAPSGHIPELDAPQVALPPDPPRTWDDCMDCGRG